MKLIGLRKRRLNVSFMRNVSSCIVLLSWNIVWGINENGINNRRKRITGGLESTLHSEFDRQTM